MRTRVRSPASLSGLRIRHCCELWCRSQTHLGSQVTVAVALAAAALIQPLAWELLHTLGVALKRPKKKVKWVISSSQGEDPTPGETQGRNPDLIRLLMLFAGSVLGSIGKDFQNHQ